ncbi:MAG: hypothetical protein AB2A00_35350 [Myxococcota bacterium]
MSRRLVLALGAMGAVALALVLVVFLDTSSPPAAGDVPPPPAPPRDEGLDDEKGWVDPEAPVAEKRRPAVDPRLAPVPDEPEPAPKPTGRFAEQTEADRKRLGDAAFLEMDDLWTRGRRPRSSPEAMAALEELLEKFPDTYRAGCAAYELGQHHLKNGRKAVLERMEAAQPLLERARDRYRESRCDSDVAAANMASLALALEVYRLQDRRRAMAVLDELAALPPTETDHLGKPLADKARFMKEHLPPTPELGGDKPPTGKPPSTGP